VVTVISDAGKLGWLKRSFEDKRMEIYSVHYNVTSLCFIPYKLMLAWYESLRLFHITLRDRYLHLRDITYHR